MVVQAFESSKTDSVYIVITDAVATEAEGSAAGEWWK